MMNRAPPIVGMPCFAKSRVGPSRRMFWPMPKRRWRRIYGPPKMSPRRNAERITPRASIAVGISGSGLRRRLDERIGELVEREGVRSLDKDGVAAPHDPLQEHECLGAVGDLMRVAKPCGARRAHHRPSKLADTDQHVGLFRGCATGGLVRVRGERPE